MMRGPCAVLSGLYSAVLDLDMLIIWLALAAGLAYLFPRTSQASALPSPVAPCC